ncbi:alanine racemase [Natrinema gelatinilyticum]|uniref:alanine racemase n=1 Tax=Natrinema gelatinilyticum TaxID=2961571 RepID=UPI0020C2907E|nr:alanine racemase [Natrinema gelatinilyticum]
MPLRTPADAPTQLYRPIDEVETPVVVVDLDAMDRNMTDYVSFAREHDVALRSHVKTHKIPDLAHMQHRSTGDGVVCQTLGEVEVMAQNGIDDVYLSYSVVQRSKLERLVWLSEKLESFATTVDCRGNIDPLQSAAARHDTTVTAILEIDLGYGRTGVAPESAVELAEYVADASNLEFGGVMAFEAHVKADAESRADLERRCLEAMDGLADVVEAIKDAGVAVPDVKVGSTATSKFSGTHPVVTEINPGMYPFNDTGELGIRSYELDESDCAATVISTVISKPASDRVVVDAGSKSISMDTSRIPIPKHRDDLEYVRASEEHGLIDASAADDVEVGDRVEFIVPHVCTTINLHDTVIGVRDGEVREVWEVQARGKVR